MAKHDISDMYLKRLAHTDRVSKIVVPRLKELESDYLITTYEDSTIVGSYPVYSLAHSKTEEGWYRYFIEFSYVYGRLEFYRKNTWYDNRKISFSELFENCPEEIQQKMLFDLDLFLEFGEKSDE